MRTVLVLGGYGLIGSAVCRALGDAGFSVVGLGRSRAAAMADAPRQQWVFHDLRSLDASTWKVLLKGVDVIVNAAGALQDGLRDDLEAVHATMLEHICASAEPGMRLVQISAAGVAPDATTEFFRSKTRGDEKIKNAGCEWVILRPGLVLAPEAYGGTALLRGVAGLPGIQLHAFPDSLVQTVYIDDVADAVVSAARGDVPTGTIADIAEPTAHALSELVLRLRTWQGFRRPRLVIRVPFPILALAGQVADALGWLGWRSPLRTTAIMVLKDGVRCDLGPWQAAGGVSPRGLDQTLASLRATRQERLFARQYFVLPLAIAVLSVFWLASGIVALASPSVAASTLEGSAMPTWAVGVTVVGGALTDIVLGLSILWRPWCRTAALGMILVAVAYLVGGTLFLPALWLDPLGPLVKIFPSIVLALIVWLSVESR